ncbi:MAG: hypothetical protein Q4G50_00195 [Corynebacterium sp.]|uniref:hypothetical protein n=1 Tax=Corynebacterium sp. TaxID=1720 RepID=UPI0026E01894|nr:hypothetical protein [Corynebacterium sp.]MDO5668408.1 hypothetical protein [Corynebacterium sp.]
MKTTYVRQLLDRCVIRADGLILRSDQLNMPDASNVMRMLIRHGAIVQIGRGAYVITQDYQRLRGWERFRLQAIGLGNRKGRILAGYSAAELHRLWTYDSVPQTHCLYRRANGARIKENGLVTSRELHFLIDDDNHLLLDGIQVTTVARTIVDLLRVHGFGAGFVAACCALRRHKITVADLESELEKTNARLPQELLLGNVTGVVESAQEAMFLAQVVFFGDFEVIPQVKVRGSDGTEYRVDFKVKGSTEYIELDGDEKYGADAQTQVKSLRKEKNRTHELAQEGVVPRSYNYRQVVKFHAYRGTLNALGLPPRLHLPMIHRS